MSLLCTLDNKILIYYSWNEIVFSFTISFEVCYVCGVTMHSRCNCTDSELGMDPVTSSLYVSMLRMVDL